MTGVDSGSRDADGAIRVEQRGHVLLVGIDRPEKLNGFSAKMFNELADAFERAEKDNSVRVSVLHAFGPNFTAGIQLDQMAGRLEEGRPLTPEGKTDPFGLFEPLRSKPVVTAVQGICFTVAIELMLATDIVVAATDARFGQIEVRRGIFANHGATLRIVERAGWGNAMRYLLTGDEFDAETAYRLGMVQELVEPGMQLGRAVELAERIAGQAPLAVREMIVSARKGIMSGWPSAIADFGPVQSRLMRTEDAREGLASFRERRPGRFVGR